MSSQRLRTRWRVKTSFVADYRAQFANPYKAAELGYIDAVIRPEDLRRRLVDTFDVLGNKRQSLPPKKHGNIPL